MDQLCAECKRKVRQAERELTHFVPRFVGTNQHSPSRKWKGNQVTALQYKILRELQEARGSISMADLRRIVYGEFDPVGDQDHALRQQVWKLRRTLVGWTIDRTQDGYKLVELKDDVGSTDSGVSVG